MTKVWKWRDEAKPYLKDGQTLIRNKQVVYNIIYGQCSPSIQEILIGDKDHKNKSDDSDTKCLLDQLRLLCVDFNRSISFEERVCLLLQPRHYYPHFVDLANFIITFYELVTFILIVHVFDAIHYYVVRFHV